MKNILFTSFWLGVQSSILIIGLILGSLLVGAIALSSNSPWGLIPVVFVVLFFALPPEFVGLRRFLWIDRMRTGIALENTTHGMIDQRYTQNELLAMVPPEQAKKIALESEKDRDMIRSNSDTAGIVHLNGVTGLLADLDALERMALLYAAKSYLAKPLHGRFYGSLWMGRIVGTFAVTTLALYVFRAMGS